MQVLNWIPIYIWIALIAVLVLVIWFSVVQGRKRNVEVDELQRAFNERYDPRSDQSRESILSETERERTGNRPLKRQKNKKAE